MTRVTDVCSCTRTCGVPGSSSSIASITNKQGILHDAAQIGRGASDQDKVLIAARKSSEGRILESEAKKAGHPSSWNPPNAIMFEKESTIGSKGKLTAMICDDIFDLVWGSHAYGRPAREDGCESRTTESQAKVCRQSGSRSDRL